MGARAAAALNDATRTLRWRPGVRSGAASGGCVSEVATELRDRARGAWVGLAVADAIAVAGSPAWAPDQVPRDLPAGGPERVTRGVFGAATSLALVAAEAWLASSDDDGDEERAWRAGVARWWRDARWCPFGAPVGVDGATRAWLATHGWAVGEPPTPDGRHGAPASAFGWARALVRATAASAASGVRAVGDARALAAPEAEAPLAAAWRATIVHGVVAPVGGEAGAAAEAARCAAAATGFVGALACVRAADPVLLPLVGAWAGARFGLADVPARWRAQVAWGTTLLAAADRLLDADPRAPGGARPVPHPALGVGRAGAPRPRPGHVG